MLEKLIKSLFFSEFKEFEPRLKFKFGKKNNDFINFSEEKEKYWGVFCLNWWIFKHRES